MKVIFNTWTGAFFQSGGGEVQLLETKNALEAKGVSIELFDMWKPQEGDILHQFSIQAGCEHVVKRYKEWGAKVVTSPIMWFCPEKTTDEFYRIKYILDQSDFIFPNSDLESDRISQHFGIDRSKFVKTVNAVSNAYASQGDPSIFREKFQIEGDFILTVGNIDERKATHLLVEACKKLNKKLVVVGHNKEPEYFDTFKDSYSDVVFLGAINEVEILKSAYRACSLFALPSLCETPGIAAMEAATQGAKIVITNEGSAQEYFKDFVTYVSPWNLNSIVEGIERELESKSRRNIEEFVLENYTWEKCARSIKETYELL